MSSWLHVGGTDPKTLNPDPWQYLGFDTPPWPLCAMLHMQLANLPGAPTLTDESCKADGRVPPKLWPRTLAQLISHYTQDATHDDCGHWYAPRPPRQPGIYSGGNTW